MIIVAAGIDSIASHHADARVKSDMISRDIASLKTSCMILHQLQDKIELIEVPGRRRTPPVLVSILGMAQTTIGVARNLRKSAPQSIINLNF